MLSGTATILIFAVFMGLLLGGMWIPFAIGIGGLVYLVAAMGPSGLDALGLVAWGSTNSFTLTAVPLFILLAELLLRSGLSDRLYAGLSRVVCVLPGGLLQTNVAGCAVFAAISGSSTATAAAIGTVALPQLKERKYCTRLSTGTLAAGGTLGILIPPSLAFIIYGTFTDTSIAHLFAAGLLPGLVLTAMFMVYVGVIAVLRPGLAPREELPPWSPALVLRTVSDVVPATLLIASILGAIYTGVVTPTEAAGLGCTLAFIVCAIWGDLTLAKIRGALRRTVVVSAGLMFIVLAAHIFSYAISMAGLPQMLADWIAGLGLSRTEFLLAVILLYLVLGCFMEAIGIMVVTIPLMQPLLASFGIDPIWFGVLLVVLIELGQITPPLGMNLFVIQGIRTEGHLGEVAMGTAPFVLIMLGLIGILFAVPELATWLPESMAAR